CRSRTQRRCSLTYLHYFFFSFFFFSSRRRHTRFSRDWSSDVCSSDLWFSPAPSTARIKLRANCSPIRYLQRPFTGISRKMQGRMRSRTLNREKQGSWWLQTLRPEELILTRSEERV